MPQLILSRVLKRKGLSKRQFAKMLGIQYRNVFKYFEDGYDPKFSTVLRWAAALKIKVRDLIDEK